MKKTEWHDARIEKPKTYEGVSDLMFVLTSNGLGTLAIWDACKGLWYDPETEETFGDVLWWFDFPLPERYRFADFYYRYGEDA